MKKAHLALYGNVKLIRGYCAACETTAIIQDGLYACCDEPVEANVTKAKRISEPEFRRYQPTAGAKREILEAQGNACLYCQHAFGSHLIYHGKPTRLEVRWDHLVPYMYAADNDDGNFAAACQICNGWKSDHIFQTLEEARVFIAGKWEQERSRG